LVPKGDCKIKNMAEHVTFPIQSTVQMTHLVLWIILHCPDLRYLRSDVRLEAFDRSLQQTMHTFKACPPIWKILRKTK
jgi:hypothetical protein